MLLQSLPYRVENGGTTDQRNPLKFSSVTGVIVDHVSVSLVYYSIKHMPYVDVGCRKSKRPETAKHITLQTMLQTLL